MTPLIGGATALLLLLWPALVLALLFGSRQPGAETLVVARVAGRAGNGWQLLWLAVAYHVALAGWGIACLAQRRAPERR